MPGSPGKTNEIPAFAGMTSFRMSKLFKCHSSRRTNWGSSHLILPHFVPEIQYSACNNTFKIIFLVREE